MKVTTPEYRESMIALGQKHGVANTDQMDANADYAQFCAVLDSLRAKSEIAFSVTNNPNMAMQAVSTLVKGQVKVPGDGPSQVNAGGCSKSTGMSTIVN